MTDIQIKMLLIVFLNMKWREMRREIVICSCDDGDVLKLTTLLTCVWLKNQSISSNIYSSINCVLGHFDHDRILTKTSILRYCLVHKLTTRQHYGFLMNSLRSKASFPSLLLSLDDENALENG